MKTKKILPSVILVVMLVLPVLSFAQTTTSNGAGAEERIKAGVEQRKEAPKNSVEERRQNAINKTKDLVSRFIQNMAERFGAAVGRLEKLANRIDSRIAKMEAKNADVSKAKELLAEARIKIGIAKTSSAGVASTTISISSATTTDVIKKDFEIVKTQMRKAKENLKKAHAALVDVINNLKPGYNKLKSSSSATSTDSGRATTTTVKDNN